MIQSVFDSREPLAAPSSLPFLLAGIFNAVELGLITWGGGVASFKPRRTLPRLPLS